MLPSLDDDRWRHAGGNWTRSYRWRARMLGYTTVAAWKSQATSGGWGPRP
jgi:hypothetical protein